MVKSFKILAIASLSLIAVGCSTTPTQPKTFAQLGQFQQIPLNANTYRVQFKADQNSSYGHAEEIALVKSAQLTVQEGFEFFKVIDDPSNRLNQQKARQTVVYPSAPMMSSYPGFYSPRYRHNPYYWPDPFFDAPYTVNLDPIEVSYTIQVFKKNNAPGDAFEARRILQSLGDKYQLNSDGTPKTPPAITSTQK